MDSDTILSIYKVLLSYRTLYFSFTYILLLLAVCLLAFSLTEFVFPRNLFYCTFLVWVWTGMDDPSGFSDVTGLTFNWSGLKCYVARSHGGVTDLEYVRDNDVYCVRRPYGISYKLVRIRITIYDLIFRGTKLRDKPIINQMFNSLFFKWHTQVIPPSPTYYGLFGRLIPLEWDPRDEYNNWYKSLLKISFNFIFFKFYSHYWKNSASRTHVVWTISTGCLDYTPVFCQYCLQRWLHRRGTALSWALSTPPPSPKEKM